MSPRGFSPLRAVLFDWDGTLVNSAEASYRCYVRLFGALGIPFDRASFERTYSPNWYRTYAALGLSEERWSEADALWLEYYDGQENELLPGAAEALARLRDAGLVQGIVTSGERERVAHELTALGVDSFFRAVVCADDARNRKPHPEALLLALDRLGIAPAEASYVGDSPEDVEMARAAGVVSVGIPGGFPNRDALVASIPDVLVEDLGAAVERLLQAKHPSLEQTTALAQDDGGGFGRSPAPALALGASMTPETRPIPMVDLKAQYARIRDEIDAAVARVLETTQFIKGEDCVLFEREFAAYCGAAHACGVANGTDALTLSLKAFGVGPGDEVVTVANTFIATAEAILWCGARPVFVDVDPRTHTMDPAAIEGALTPSTKLILPVHLYGHPADMSPIAEVAARHGLPVLEDAAQAHGAEVDGRRAGSLGHAACFSFYPAKNLGAYGDAGAVVSSDADFVARARSLANHGSCASKYEHAVPGTNSRLDSLQAAVLRVKLRHLDGWDRERRERVSAYSEALRESAAVGLPTERPGARSAWHLYTIRVADRDGLQAHLKRRGIASAIHYPKPLHLQPALAALGGKPGDLPASEALAREVISLPLYPELPLEAVGRIAAEVKAFCGAVA